MRVAELTHAMPAPLVHHLRSWAGAVPERPGLSVIAGGRDSVKD